MFWPKSDLLSFLSTKMKKKTNKQKQKTKPFPIYTFLDHVDSFGKFVKFFVEKHFFTLVQKRRPKHCFCHFLKNTVPCGFSLLKLHNYHILYFISFQVMPKTIFTQSYEGGTILKRQIFIFTFELAPRQQKFFRCPANVEYMLTYLDLFPSLIHRQIISWKNLIQK